MAPGSTLALSVAIRQAFGGPARVEEIEFCVRETPDAVYLLVCKREGAAVQVESAGLPENLSVGNVLYEEPRSVRVADGRFTDWLGRPDVHVYRFVRPAEGSVQHR